MRILITNDDGIDAPGLHALARGLVDGGHDVVVAAPQRDMSGSGAAIGQMHLDQHLDLEAVDLPGLDGVPAYSVVGTPALCVMAGRLGAFGEPVEVVASGINPGPNTGRSTLHSGTVGAALTAANFGISALAVSLGADEPYHWTTAATYAAAAMGWLLEQPARTVLNINVPNIPLDEVKGVRWGRLAAFGTVRTTIVEQDGRLQMVLSDSNVELAPDTDTALVRGDFVAVTSIVGIRAADRSDVDRYLEEAVHTT